ncbi:UDP-N-acetylmuramate--L-alanine ligase [Candidatus Falkowbacteria bacterium CG10_big_fil_rev_8_21_14_0_10_43_11]|uniref:UDP-N-acetylmuramate--L-alanine ligase n=1 Tax=Candidatus Falkowbacteria bacterium CG10_big_fil_rev_8_21_14_0_10_43_11 TaxID=1974568 RepID=A0A2M6WMN3_9BACT|nr:MAG: UDP-N-acetylmuramate--L-alanine ligase [Candidatus Falkowbacteria bacterium CG10_big_fil_rev_8_21_14_0_10_43_11]
MQVREKQLKPLRNIYFIGIKGVGMTALAQILSAQGKKVSGSDTPEKFFTDKVLKRAKIPFVEGFAAINIPADAELIIRSGAYTAENNAEVAEAIKRELPILTQAEVLAELFNDKYGIAVCGSHGKTTTSALLAFILWQTGLDPTAAIGSAVPQFSGNALVGKGKIMVIEADEYQNKLKLYQPKIVVLNNIDYDHPDFFKTPRAYRQAFVDFVKKIPRDCFTVVNFNNQEAKLAAKNCRTRVFSYGYTTLDKYRILPDIVLKNGWQYFYLQKGKQDLGEFKMQIIGRHNVENATAVIATCLELKISLAKVKRALAKFKGTARRMEILGKYKGALFIDDYAHHPTEIQATLLALRQQYQRQRIICAFMPHTYTRTKALFDDFAKSFINADEIIILPIYGSAREKQGGVSSEELAKKIGKNTLYASSIQSCAAYLKQRVTKKNIVVLMGAGDAFRVWHNLKQ